MPMFTLAVPGLATAVQACPLHSKHKHLIELLRSASGLDMPALKWVASRGFYAHVQRQIVMVDGQIVHPDSRQWLTEQLSANGGNVSATFERLRKGGFYQSHCELEALYLVADRGHATPADFVQIEVYIERDVVDRTLFGDNFSEYAKPHTASELMACLDEGVPVPEAERLLVRPVSYKLMAMLDVGLFVDEAHGLDMLERQAIRGKRYELLDPQDGSIEIKTQDQLDPGWDAEPFKMRRLFDDWQHSSAGLSGARLCDHWFVQVSDYTDPRGRRYMGLVPQWTHSKKMPLIESRKGDAQAFVDALEKLDLRAGVPFAWYFFMLHGNRVKDEAGHRMLHLLESDPGLLPAHDAEILRRWARRPYGF